MSIRTTDLESDTPDIDILEAIRCSQKSGLYDLSDISGLSDFTTGSMK